MSTTLRIRSDSLYRVTRETWRTFADASGGMIRETRVMSGARYRRTRELTDTVEDFNAYEPRLYRIEDGHLPDYQPRANGVEVRDAIEADPWLSAVEMPRLAP